MGDTPELEAAAMAETERNPGRFDDTKRFSRNSWWKFCKWDRTDPIGFVACCSLSAAFAGICLGRLKWAAP